MLVEHCIRGIFFFKKRCCDFYIILFILLLSQRCITLRAPLKSVTLIFKDFNSLKYVEPRCDSLSLKDHLDKVIENNVVDDARCSRDIACNGQARAIYSFKE